MKTTRLAGTTDLSVLPFQLDFADVSQWLHSGDSCRISGTSWRLDHFLRHVCTCGLVSLTSRRVDEVALSGELDASEWIPYVMHIMKEFIMPRFFRGAVFL